MLGDLGDLYSKKKRSLPVLGQFDGCALELGGMCVGVVVIQCDVRLRYAVVQHIGRRCGTANVEQQTGSKHSTSGVLTRMQVPYSQLSTVNSYC